jgi:putative adhesin
MRRVVVQLQGELHQHRPIGRRKRRKAMRKMNVLVAVIGVIALLAAGSTWLALGGWKQIGTRFEDDASSAAAISEIRVTGRSVEVDVRPGTGTGVKIHRTARYLNPFHAQPGPTHQIEGDVLTLSGDDACTFCVIEYSVTVPEGVRVSANVTSGSLNLKGVSTVDATTTSGSITISDATGAISARTDSGTITGAGLRSGAVVASAKSGSISLELAAPGDVQATTTSGSLGLTVPSAAYRVDATAGSGGADIRIANDPNGQYRLDLKAQSGHIMLAGS